MAYRVADLFEENRRQLQLELIAGQAGLKKMIKVPEAHRPGLALAGYFNGHSNLRLLIFGKVELNYLKDLNEKVRTERLMMLLSSKTPAVFVSRRFRPPQELIWYCEEKAIPLFRSSLTTMILSSKLSILLSDQFAPTQTCHGSLVEVFGVGVLIQGESSVGKSEASLGLIERGHRLISDDIVRVKKREGGYLEGSGVELSRHHMEIRGIGIINVAHIYGAVCVRDKKSLDIVVKLEVWKDEYFYDRVGLEEETISILGVAVPFHLLPVKPGRDVVLLLETIASNHRLKQMGYHSAKEFNAKLLSTLERKGTHERNHQKNPCNQ